MRSIIPLICLLASVNCVSATDLVISPDTRFQKVEGWGVSLCWWANMVGQWEDEAAIDELLHLLTDPDQLNLNVFRYNIPGGDDPSHVSKPGAPGHMAEGKGIRAEMEGFKPHEEGPFNPEADAGQRNVLQKLNRLRNDAIFEAFSNSPPYWMTVSGCASGNTDPNKDNLKREYYEDFADYLVDVCLYYKRSHGIDFRTLAPFNEPQSNYWNAMGSQEGCHFDIDSQLEFIRVLSPILGESGLETRISVSDETNLPSSIKAVKAYSSDRAILEEILQFNTHTYKGSDAERVTLRQLAKEADKPLWQSETGPLGMSLEGLASNLAIAQRLITDMRILQPVAWLDWQVMDTSDKWALIKGRLDGGPLTLHKNFYVRMQATRFIKQGATIVDANLHNSLAAVNPNGDLILVVVNESNQNAIFEVKIDSRGYDGREVNVYRTSSDEDCKLIQRTRFVEALPLDMPGHSISTLIFSAR